MNNAIPSDPEYLIFTGNRLLARGSLAEVALLARDHTNAIADAPLLVIDAHTSQLIDLDLRGSAEEVLGRLATHPVVGTAGAQSVGQTGADQTGEQASTDLRTRGRPKLGVTAREVTLLPRHWQWLSEQPGGASVTLRKLVDSARQERALEDLRRRARDSAYRFMSILCGDLAGFEEATRALFAGNRQRFDAEIAEWPADVRSHLSALANSGFGAAGSAG